LANLFKNQFTQPADITNNTKFSGALRSLLGQGNLSNYY
jgi:hypothetical protein